MVKDRKGDGVNVPMLHVSVANTQSWLSIGCLPHDPGWFNPSSEMSS